MRQASDERHTARLEWIRTSRERAEHHSHRLRRLNSRVIYASILAGSLATALAGFAAAAGSPLASWRITCGIVAMLTLCATVASGVQKQMDLGSQLSRVSSCLGKLRAVEYAATMGTRSPEEIDSECEEITRDFPEFLV